MIHKRFSIIHYELLSTRTFTMLKSFPTDLIICFIFFSSCIHSEMNVNSLVIYYIKLNLI
jgi:hypothetical protein